MSALTFSISAVLACGSRGSRNILSAITSRKTRVFSTTQLTNNPNAPESKMSWQELKQKYLTMGLADKRKEYKCKQYFTLDNVPTWTQYKSSRQDISPKIDLPPHVKIDGSMNELLAKKVSLFGGDITSLEIDAVVNAANKSLRGGMGVDGAIHRGAGPSLLAENVTLGGCNVGEAKITGGYKLPAKHVIPTVGPQGEKPDLLKQCYKNAIDVMLANNLKTIAFPCISTGVYGYPAEPAAHVALGQVRAQLEKNSDKINRVIFCVFLESDKNIYESLMQSYFPLN